MIQTIIDNLLKLLPHNYSENPTSNIGKLIAIIREQLTEVNEKRLLFKKAQDIDQAEGELLDLIGRSIGQERGQFDDEIYRLLIKSRIRQNLSPGDINSIIEYIATLFQIPRENITISENPWGSFKFSSQESVVETNEYEGFNSVESLGIFHSGYTHVDQFVLLKNKINTSMIISDEKTFDYLFNNLLGTDSDYNLGNTGGTMTVSIFEPAYYRFNITPDSLNSIGFPIQDLTKIVKNLSAAGVRIEFYVKGTFAFSATDGVVEYSEEESFDNGNLGAYYNPDEGFFS